MSTTTATKLYVQDGKFTPEFDAYAKKKMDKWHVSGMSIAVIQGDGVCAKGYGLARLPDEPITPKTLFNCASMTKAFTAAAASLLVDDEKFPNVKWSTPMSHLIGDDFVLSDGRYTAEVTLEDLLSHRSGLHDCDDACYGIYAKNPDNPKSVVRKLRHIPLIAPLRSTHIYCNVGYVVVAHMIESLTGQWLGDFLRSRIWDPLGMKDTFYGLDELKKVRRTEELAKSYRWHEEEEKFEEIPWCDQPEGSGCGEMYSNVLDYAQFLKCMMKKSAPFSEVGHKELIKPRIIDDLDEEPLPFMAHTLYALGWEIQNFNGEMVIGHDGSVNGFASKMIYIPRLKWGMVAFANKDFASQAVEGIAWALVEELMEIPEEKKFDWDEEMERKWEKYKPKTREELFPKIPDPKISLSRPLEKYAGVYRHPGFGEMVVELHDGNLQIDCTDRTWRFMLYLEHVSGEFFFVRKFNIDSKETSTGKARFQLDAYGTVRSFWADLIDGPDEENELVWFDRETSEGEIEN